MNRQTSIAEAWPSPRAAAGLLEVSGLEVSFATAQGSVSAVRGVDLRLDQAEILGLVGESGCGKSVTCQALLGLLPGTARVKGSISIAGERINPFDRRGFERLRGRTASMIFQDPMSALDPLMTISRHLLQRLKRHRKGENAGGISHDLLRQVGVPDAKRMLRSYPHWLSGGMCQRAAISLALAGSPRLLIADEPTTALDVTVQAQVLDLLADLRQSQNLAVVLISHDLGVVAEICDRIAVMYAGQIVETGPTREVLDSPGHPYTQGLLASRPALTGPRGELKAIAGSTPPPGRIPSGCAFGPRCRYSGRACAAEPQMHSLDSVREVRCHAPLPGSDAAA